MRHLFKILVISMILLVSCKDNKQKTPLLEYTKVEASKETLLKKPAAQQTQEFKDYWYSGEAEITSYKLEQARYGELREGTAVLIYVTESFLPEVQVKADQNNPGNISVLKLNATKKFNTGVYPYSIMQSTFYPTANNQHALKVSCSVQEWCGHVYSQLNNKALFEVSSHSYFQNEADLNFKLDKAILENELWTQLRMDPQQLPTGDLQIIPSFEYLRLGHIPLKAYKASVQLSKNSYIISYPELNRTLTIAFNAQFPYDILGWEETFKSGFGQKAKVLTTKATKLKLIKSSYWNKNQNSDSVLRKELLLE